MDSSVIQNRWKKWVGYVVLIAMALAIGVIVAPRVFPLEESQQETVMPSSPLLGKRAPDFTLPTLDGTEVSLSQFLGQPVLINSGQAGVCPARRKCLNWFEYMNLIKLRAL